MRKQVAKISLELGKRFPLRRLFCQILTLLLLWQTILPSTFASPSSQDSNFSLAKKLLADSGASSNSPKEEHNQQKISVSPSSKTIESKDPKRNIKAKKIKAFPTDNYVSNYINQSTNSNLNGFYNPNNTTNRGISNLVSTNSKNKSTTNTLNHINSNIASSLIPSKANNNSVNPLSLQGVNEVALVRHSPSLNGGRAEGSIRVLLGEQTNINAGTVVTADLYVPGNPNIRTNGNVNYNGTVEGIGSSNPSDYGININNNSTLRHIVTHTDPVTMPSVNAPPNPTGTRNIVLARGESPGDFSTIRDITLQPSYGGLLTVPPGTYNRFTASNNTGFIFGIAGQNTTYNLQDLVLNSSTQLQILGTVTINIKNQVNLNSQSTIGSIASPISLTVNVSNGGVNFNSQSSFYGQLRAPQGVVNLNANSLVQGFVICDRLNLNANSLLKGFVGDTTSPIVTITQPQNDSTLTQAQVVVTGTFTDDSAVSLVKVNNITATIDGTSFSAIVSLNSGSNTITATATDAFGNNGQSVITVTRTDGSNQAPTVSAGADQTITLPSTANLVANASDDGLPNPPSQLTFAWSKVSGVGNVTFSQGNQLSTTATFSIAGTYVLRITASDSLLSASDDIEITVNPAQPQNQAPVVSAGADQTITLPASASLTAQASDDGLPSPPAQLTYSWSKVSGTGNVTFSSPNSLSTTASFSAAGSYTLRFTASDSVLDSSDEVVITVNPSTPQNLAPVVSAGSDQSITLPNNATLQGSVTDDGLPQGAALSITWTKLSGEGNVTFSSPNTAITQASFSNAGTYTLRLSASDTELTATDDVLITVSGAANEPPTVSAGSDQSITLPSTASLTAQATDDGLPNPPSQLTFSWTKVSGPGTVSFSSPNSLSTTASFSIDGSYTLRFTASDSVLSSSDDVVITVNPQAPQNQAPTVSAGADQTITLPNSANLVATASDDNLPNPPSALTYSWTKVSGDGNVTFSSPNSLTTTASFSVSGSYTLRFTASDSVLSASDDVVITVEPAPPAQNQAPQVNAGSDQALIASYGPNVIKNYGGEADLVNNAPANWTIASFFFNWIKVQAGTPPYPNAVEGNSFFTVSANTCSITQDVDLSLYSQSISSGNQKFTFTASIRAGQNNSTASVELFYLSSTGSVLASYSSGSVAPIDWTAFSDLRTAPTGTTTIRIKITSGGGYIDALSLRALIDTQSLATANLSATVTDDGLPNPPGQVSLSWTKISGPGTVVFATPNLATTTATFSDLGTYILRFSANDSEFTAIDNLSVSIKNINNLAGITVNAGDDQSIESALGLNLIQNPGGEASIVNNAPEDWTIASFFFSWVRPTAGTAPYPDAVEGSSFFAINGNPSSITQDINLSEYSQSISTGNQKFVFTASIRAGQNNTTAIAEIFYLSSTGNTLASYTTTAVAPSDWTAFYDLRSAPIGTTTARVKITSSGGYIDALSLRALINSTDLPSTSLSASVLEDSNPVDSRLFIQWTKLSGPGAVIFSEPNKVNTTASFTTTGIYTLRVTSSDLGFSLSDDLVVTITSASGGDENFPPIVNAGSDKKVSLPHSVTLSGTVTDDGLPTPTNLTVTWSQVSGPGSTTFSSPNSLNTTASFSLDGTYVLRLTASDSQLSTSDDITVIVEPYTTVPYGATFYKYKIVTYNELPGFEAINFDDNDFDISAAAFGFSTCLPFNTEWPTFTDILLRRSFTLPANSTNVQVRVAIDNDVQVFVNGIDVSGGLRVHEGCPQIDSFIFSVPANVLTSGENLIAVRGRDRGEGTFIDLRITADISTSSNTPPVVNTGNDQIITLPTNSVSLNAFVVDDGLPANSTLSLSWSKVSGDGNVTFSSPNTAQSSATFSGAGTYTLRLTASDSEFTSSDDVVVIVNPLGQQNQRPVVNAGADQSIALTTIATLVGTATDDGLPTGSSLFFLWEKVSGPGTVGFSAPNSLQTQAQFSTEGVYVLRLSVSDTQLTGTDEIQVTVTNPTEAEPTVIIHSPTDGTTITNLTNVVATISYTGASVNWVLDYSLNANDDLDATRSYTTIATGNTTVNNATIATFDPTLMLNGSYLLRLTVTDNHGRIVNTIVTSVLDKNLKVGNFTLSFTDASVPVAGIPITVIRTYDSRDKRNGDFGVGWHLDVKNIRLEKTSNLGKHWLETLDQEGFTFRYRLVSTRSKFVTITFPDGKVFKFKAVPSPDSQIAAIVNLNGMNFVPEPGTEGTLVPMEAMELRVEGDIPQTPPGAGQVQIINLQGNNPGQPFNPRLFKLTTLEGVEFIIDEFNGLQSVKDLNDNTLTVNSNGIIHSSGKSITFTRDAQGRITQLTDPNNNVTSYTYNSDGDLVSVKDAENNTTSFSYINNHYLLDITDPRGIKPIRNDYDNDGRLIKHTDSFGREIIYTHQVSAKREIITDRLGNPTTFEYDDNGNVLKRTDALGHSTSYTYDSNDNQLTETNALGKTTTSTYDAVDNLLTTTDPLGNTATYTYNGRRQVLTIKDPKGNVTTNTYDAKGNLSSTKDALNHTTTFTYNSQGLVLTQTDAQNNVTTYQYTGSQPSQITDALGNITSFTYDQNGNQLTQTVTRTFNGSPETITTTNTYDKLNRVTKVTYPDGSETTTTYNAIGKVASSTDQLGRSTSFTYDNQGQLLSTTFPDLTSTSSTYDAEGRRLTSTDQLGRVTSFQYDQLGRLTKTTTPDNSFTTTVYDAIGRVTSTTDQLGHTTTYEYDENCGCSGRRSKIIDALGNETSFAYDQNGNQTSFTDARGNTTSYTYDQLNRQTRTTFPDATFTETVYDSLGRVISQRDQAGKIKQSFYDKLGRLIKVKDALNHETQYGYDELGQQITQTDAKGRITRYEYDKLGRRTKRILPMGQFETYSYDLAGRLINHRDFNNKITTRTYDQLNRLTSEIPDASFNQAPITFTYNNLGQIATATGVDGTITLSYDNRNRLIQAVTPQGTLTYSYNVVGNILSVNSSNPNGLSTEFGYDLLNRLQTVKDNNLQATQQLTSYNYDQVGNLSAVNLPNQVATSYLYNTLNRLTNVSTSKLGNTISSYAYTLGAAGNRLSVSELSGRSVSYGYDSIYRLINETISGVSNPSLNGSVSYNYDEVGNRLSRTSTLAAVPSQQNIAVDNNDRLTTDSYDDNGNTVGADGRNYTYDYKNRIIGVTAPGLSISIKYNAFGDRVEKTVNGVTTKYLIDRNNHTGYAQVVEEIINGVVTRQYTYGLDLISQRQLINGNRTTHFYGYDGHGSVRYLTDANGVITDTYDYDSFGVLINQIGNTPNNYLYAGEQFDHDLGLYYNRARYLDVNRGRFWTQDTFEGNSNQPLSLHKYLYTHGNPVNGIDPSGNLLVKELIGRGLALILGGISALALVDRVLAPTGNRTKDEISKLKADADDQLTTGVIALIGATSLLRLFATKIKGFRLGARTGAYDPYDPASVDEVIFTESKLVLQQTKKGYCVSNCAIELASRKGLIVNPTEELLEEFGAHTTVTKLGSYLEDAADVLKNKYGVLNARHASRLTQQQVITSAKNSPVIAQVQLRNGERHAVLIESVEDDAQQGVTFFLVSDPRLGTYYETSTTFFRKFTGQAILSD